MGALFVYIVIILWKCYNRRRIFILYIMKVSVFMSVIRSINHLFNSYLSWIVLLMAVLAYMLPTVFSWMTPYIAYMLQFVMFAMGLTLTAQVFLDVFKQPMKVILVSVIQF